MEQKENKEDNSEDIHTSSVTASAHYLRTSFGLTDDVFNQIHTEVTAILRTLPLERKDVLSTKATVTFTSTLLDDLLDQINSTFTDLFVYANSPHGSPLTASTNTETAEKLVLSTATKVQEFWRLCLVSDWLSASQDSGVNIHEVLEDRLPYITAETVRAVIDCLLSSCSEETSEDLQGFRSYVPLCNFLKAVADSIKTESSPKASTPMESTSAAGSNMVAEPPSAVPPQSDSDVADREGHSAGAPSDDFESFTSLHMKFSPWPRLASRNTLKTSVDFTETSAGELQRPISTPSTVSQGQNWKVDSIDQEELAEIIERITSQPLALWTSKLVSSTLMNEASEMVNSKAAKDPCTELRKSPVISSSVESCTSSLAVVTLLTFKLTNYFEEVFKLADPSVKPDLYTSLVKLVSEMMLDSAKAKVREILVMNLLTIFETVTSVHDSADLNNSLQSGSKKLVKSVVQRVKEALPDSVESGINWPKRRTFLESVEDSLDPRSKKIKTLKLSFKTWKNKEEPNIVLSKKQTEENPVPTGPKPKKKNRVSAFFRRVWQRVRLTCSCCCYKKIHPDD
ncbi:hypothetical protein MHYP_G00204730 [Metynnis hypsauchen]